MLNLAIEDPTSTRDEPYFDELGKITDAASDACREVVEGLEAMALTVVGVDCATLPLSSEQLEKLSVRIAKAPISVAVLWNATDNSPAARLVAAMFEAKRHGSHLTEVIADWLTLPSAYRN